MDRLHVYFGKLDGDNDFVIRDSLVASINYRKARIPVWVVLRTSNKSLKLGGAYIVEVANALDCPVAVTVTLREEYCCGRESAPKWTLHGFSAASTMLL
jgi:hypothetical protein